MPTNYVLVDYENVQPNDVDFLKAPTLKVKVFLGPTQSKVPVSLAQALQPLGANAEYVQLETAGTNALDFHIAFYIGALSHQDPSAHFHIISTLAWVDAWQRASEGEEQMGFPALRRTPDYVAGAAVPPRLATPAVVVPAAKKRRAKPTPDTAPKRHLVDVDSLVPEKRRAAAATPPEGRIVAPPVDVKLDKPRSGGGTEKSGESHKPAPGYTPWDRETTGLRMLRKIVSPVEVRDTRTEHVGADGIGTDGRYYELKVHGGAANGPLEMRGSEVLRARDMGDRYVLVVVENVEAQDATPKITFVPSPMSVLSVHPIGKIEVTGYDDEAFEQWELPSESR